MTSDEDDHYIQYLLGNNRSTRGDDDADMSDSSADESTSDDHSYDPTGTFSTNNTSGDRASLGDLQDLLFLQQASTQLRSDPWDHRRLCWDEHVAQLSHEGMFEREYLMSYNSHVKLVSILGPLLDRVQYNSRTSQPIEIYNTLWQ